MFSRQVGRFRKAANLLRGKTKSSIAAALRHFGFDGGKVFRDFLHVWPEGLVGGDHRYHPKEETDQN